MTGDPTVTDDATAALGVHVPVPAQAAHADRADYASVHVRVWPARDDDAAARRPLLLALHGWTDSGEVFGPLARALGHRWTVMAPDAPGHGGTAWAPQDHYDIASHAEGVLAVLDALPEVAGRRRRVVVLGHSLGGVTAAQVAAARPGIVAHLVLEDPARSTPRRTLSVAARRPWVQRLTSTDVEGHLAVVREQHPGWPDDEYGPWARSQAAVDPAHLLVPAIWGEPLVAHLSEVRCPVTLVRGEPARGGIVSMTGARRCAAACRAGCDVVALETGHSPRREAREQFVAVLAAVLGRYEV